MKWPRGLWWARSCGLFAAQVALSAQAATIEGSATYRERIAAPPDAVFEARLEDVSRADAPATMLGRHRIEAAGNPPYRFRIEVADSALRPDGRYAVRATLSQRGRLLFTTDTAHLLRPGQTQAPVLTMVSARGGGAGADASSGLPASFVGEIPGAGGAIAWHVDLLPDQRYRLRRTYVGRPEPNRVDDIGRWITGADGRMELRGTTDQSLYFEPTPRGLRKLDMQARRIESAGGHNDLLERLPQPAPIEPRITATGMLRVLADAASVTLCADGRRLPVAMQGDYLALERAYAAVDKSAPGDSVLVAFEGTIAPRQIGEAAQPLRDALVVERFGKVWPRETCGQPLADSPLRNTYWKLTRLNGEPASVGQRQREPHLILNAREPRVAGSGGCNRIMGGFELDADKLGFSRMAGTLMACPDGMPQEKALLDALGQVRHWRVRGSHLELMDAQRQVLARFEAVALRK